MTQVYIRWRDQTLPAPKLQLVWFQRYLVPTGGGNVKMEFHIEAQSMAVWLDDGWHVKPGRSGVGNDVVVGWLLLLWVAGWLIGWVSGSFTLFLLIRFEGVFFFCLSLS